MSTFSKRKIALRYWLLGAGYLKAHEALEFGARLHKGTRKDGFTPEFDHQVWIAHYVRSLLPSLIHKEETLSVVFLHDVPEDFGLAYEEIDGRFGTVVTGAVRRLTKKWRGEVYDKPALFEAMSHCPIASIVKAADRVHNLKSMLGVFTLEKQQAYVAETKEYFLPMIKAARRRFPQQELAYENLKHMLLTQIETIEAMHAAQAKPAPRAKRA